MWTLVTRNLEEGKGKDPKWNTKKPFSFHIVISLISYSYICFRYKKTEINKIFF